MKNHLSLFFVKKCLYVTALLLFLIPSSARAAASDDLEKPKPEFSQEDGIITAKLIPRAKSTSVSIAFEVTGGGKLTSVNAYDINDALRPQINTKDFRSDLFQLEINGVSPGGEAAMMITSEFFTSSTYFWIFNEQLPTPWMDSKAKNTPLGEKVQQFEIRIKDGGPFDSDGTANGRITLIGGPKDSFWGYVVGTLFIRFFGVFIVLFVLMIGMLISGRIFQALEKKPAIEVVVPEPVKQVPEVPSDKVTPEMAAAVGLALALHLNQSPAQSAIQPPSLVHIAHSSSHESYGWTLEGRRRIMADRFIPFNRVKK